jgi:hypothetical protein
VTESIALQNHSDSRIHRVVYISEGMLASTIPWLAAFALFLAVNAYVHRLWIWDIGDDQNLMMPAINIGRGYVPNIDFVSGYPGLTFYIQRLVMLFTGESPFSQHVYAALQAAFFGGVAAWVLRKWYPPALVWLMVVFLWTGSHALNPTPNPGYVIEPLVLLAMVLTERLGHHGRLTDAAVAGALAGLAFLFKQYGVLIPVGFVLYTSFACLASANRPDRAWLRIAIVLLNGAAFAAYFWVYLLRSVYMVPHHDPQAAASLPISTVAFLSPWAFALGCLAVLAVRPRPLLPRGLTLTVLVKANLAFAGSFLAVGTIAFALMYGVGASSVTALRAVLFDAPKLINSNIVPPQPLQLWPEVAVTCLVVMGPLVLKELRNPVLQIAMLIGIAGVVLYAARTYTNLSTTIAPTLAFFLLVATFLAARPTGESWSWFFVFVASSTMLAYLVPYPAYAFNMGILVVSGWAMVGGTFQSAWPRLVNPLGAVALAAILALTLLDGKAAMDRMATYQVGSHLVKSYDPNIGPAVDAANATTASDAQGELYIYLDYLAHAR